ncbi:putative reverse transcriptase domain-containing protein [Tanacetum coccineum]
MLHISSDSNGPSWGIPLVNAGELPGMDPYEEVAQQGQAPPLSPAYVPGPMELDEHVPVYVPEPEHPEYLVPSDDDIQVEDQPYVDDASPIFESPGHITDSESMEEDSIDYPDEPEDDDEDPQEDPEEDHTDYPADGEDGDDEPSDDDDDDDDTDDEDEEPTEDEDEEEHLAPADPSAIPVVDPVPSAGDTEAFETDESAPIPRSPQTRVPFSQTRLRRVRKTIRLEPPISASMEACIAEHVATPIPPTNPAYDQAPLGHRAAMIRIRDDIPEEDMPPQRRFVLTAPPPGCDVAESSAAATRAPRGLYDFVDTIKAGQGFIHSPGHDAQTIARVADKAEDVGYVRALQASEHRMITSIEEVNLRVSYQAQVHRRESEDFYTQLHDARTDRRDIRLEIDVNRALLARLETLETHMSRMEWQRQSVEDLTVRQMMRTQVLEARARIDTVEDTESIQAMIDQAIQRNFTHTQDDDSQNSGGGLRRPVQPARVRENDVAAYTQRFQQLALMCTKFLADETKKVEKYISGLPDNIHGNVMQNDNKRKADDSSRNNQQPYKKQNVARAYTVNTNNNKNQKTGACYECGNTGHIKKNCPKLKNRRNGNGNGTSQGRAYALGGKDSSPDSNVITGMFLLNDRYAIILFDTGADRSFVSNTFSVLINITPTTLESHYDVELADGKIIGVNTIIRDCTLNFMNHPFNIDLMPVPLGSFNVIIRMDWLTKYHGVIIYDEKIGCDVFLAHITMKEAKDKLEGKRLEDVPIVRDFPEDLLGIPPARQVEFPN